MLNIKQLATRNETAQVTTCCSKISFQHFKLCMPQATRVKNVQAKYTGDSPGANDDDDDDIKNKFNDHMIAVLYNQLLLLI